MEKNKRNYRKRFIIITIFLLVLIIFLSIICFVTFNDYTKETNVNKELTLEYDKLVEQNRDSILIQEQINKNLNEIKMLDDNISKTRNEVFTLVSKLEQKIKNGESDYKIAYLTFDDGPYYLTYDYLKILDKYNVKATFFTIGTGKNSCWDNKSKDCTKLYSEIVNRGHTIANHTYSHAIKYGLYSSIDSFIYQVNKQEQLIKEKTGVTTNIIRFPGGSGTAKSLKNGIINELRKKNYGWVDWTAMDGDGGSISSKEQAWNIFVNSINQDIEVVLLHDYSSITVAILPDIIEYLQEKGYILLPLFYDSVMINK